MSQVNWEIKWKTLNLRLQKKRDLDIFRYKCNKILFKAEIFICEKREQHINNERKREHNNKIINKEIIPQTVL